MQLSPQKSHVLGYLSLLLSKNRPFPFAIANVSGLSQIQVFKVFVKFGPQSKQTLGSPSQFIQPGTAHLTHLDPTRAWPEFSAQLWH